MRIWTQDAQPNVRWAVLGLSVICALVLAVPGQTVTSKYVNDLLIFLDGAHRIDVGQVPNRDFHTALGPLNFYLPALGYWLSGRLGAAMPWGMAGLLLLLAPVMAHVLSTRMRPVIAIPFAAFQILILALPANVGEAVTDLSFAMFYNRIGWVALSVLFAMYLVPSWARSQQGIRDALCAAVLTLVLLYTKASYAAVAFAFLGLVLLDPRQRRWAVIGLALTLGGTLIVEFFWRGSVAHLEDLRLAGRVSGGLKDPLDFASMILRNLADYVLFGLIVGLALWRTRSVRDVLFYGLCVGAGLLLILQNYQVWGILTLHAGAAVAAETLARSETPADSGRAWAVPAAAPFLLLALLLPTIVHGTATLGWHAALAVTRAGEPFGLPRLNEARLVRGLNGQDFDSNARYLATLRDGARSLGELDPKASHVFVLDFVTPFSAALGLMPPRGDTAWLHWGRTLDEKNYIPPEELLRDVRIVMEPKHAIEGVTSENLRVVFGAYLDAQFDLVRDTAEWKIYVNRAWRPDKVSAAAAG